MIRNSPGPQLAVESPSSWQTGQYTTYVSLSWVLETSVMDFEDRWEITRVWISMNTEAWAW